VLEQIEEKTDGVPLFIEELTKTILEAGILIEREQDYVLDGPLPPLAIPSTLHDALLARLDRLSHVKEVAQIGACIGRRFSFELLSQVSPLDPDELERALLELTTGELVFRRGAPPRATYTFKHALVQDTAYQSLLRRTREGIHRRIADALRLRFPQTAETQPELLAHHYSCAALHDAAVGYWLRAGQRAGERSAHLEAISHLERGLEALATLPETPERAGRELDFQAMLGPAVMVTKGQSAPETERVYARARELCERVSESPHHFPVLWGLWYVNLARGELQTARERAQELVDVARQRDDPALLVPAHRAIGNTLLWLGEVEPACTYLEDGVAIFDPRRHRSLMHRYGQDLSVVCGAWASWARWALGYPDRALQLSDASLARAAEVAHPLSRVYALHAAAWLNLWCGNAGVALESAESAIALCEEQEFALYMAWVKVARGGAMALTGEVRAGIEEMRSGIAGWNATGASVAQPTMLALLAEAYLRSGEPEAGTACVAEAMAYQAASGERFFDAELHRLNGRLVLACPGERHAEAVAHFHRAIAVAREQGTRLFELRAACDLARLHLEAGRTKDAGTLLRPVFDWFEEGRRNPDLEEAGQVLAAIG
jgi:predicted ATPase